MKPHFAPHGQNINADYYCNMLEGGILRQIEVIAQGEKYWPQHDLASPRAAKTTKALLKKESANLIPWMPAGADLTPLDVFVNNPAKEEVRKKDTSTLAKLKMECGMAIGRLSADPKWK